MASDIRPPRSAIYYIEPNTRSIHRIHDLVALEYRIENINYFSQTVFRSRVFFQCVNHHLRVFFVNLFIFGIFPENSEIFPFHVFGEIVHFRNFPEKF